MDRCAPSPSKPLWYSPLNLARRVGVYAVTGYLALCGCLYVSQNRLEYPRSLVGAVLPTKLAAAEAGDVGLVPWDRPTPGSPSPQGYVPEDFTGAAPRGTLVVFHGNGEWAAQEGNYVNAFVQRGFRPFLYEYPGYGGRPGTPSERMIVPDARALIRSLEKEGYGPIYVWGESLGSGVAAEVCADPNLPVHGLVLLTAWDTLANVGFYRYPFMPIEWLIRDKYDSVTNLKHFQHPICVVRGTIDEVIPPPLTIHLFAELPEPKKLIVQTGYGHGDWPSTPDLSWWDEALNFVAAPKKGS